jgi:hypothetical protein
MLTIDFVAVLTWSGQLTAALLVFVLVGFIISRIHE